MRQSKMTTLFHVDVDSFLASVEQIRHPEWRGLPVCVGGTADDRSVVASASREAKARGIRTAMTIAQARAICPHAIFTRGYFPHYQEASDAMLRVIGDFSPDYEMVSLDDVYVDMTGFDRLYGHPLPTAERLKTRIHAATGLDVTIGIGTNKLIARLATTVAKPNGIAHVWPGYEREFVAPMAVSKLPGVGPAMQRELEKLNIQTVRDLESIPEEIMAAAFGAHGELLAKRARGEDAAVVVERGLPKSISRETTFEDDTADRGIIEGMIYYLIERACRKLRGLDAKAKRLQLKVRYSDFHTRAVSCSFPQATDQDHDVFDAAMGLLPKALNRRMRVRLVGIALSNLRAGAAHQRDLFAERRAQKMRKLHDSVDAIRDRFGFSAVTVGRAIDLLDKFDKDEHGFRLRTACLTQ